MARVGLLAAGLLAASPLVADLEVGCVPEPLIAAHRVTGVGNPRFLAVADFNDDDVPDVALGGGGSSIRVLLGNGDGTFEEPFTVPLQPSGALLAADADGDDIPDLIGAVFSQLYVAIGNGDGTFEAPVSSSISGGVESLAIGLFDSDDLPDLVAVRDSFNGSVLLLLGNGDGTFDAGPPRALPQGARSVAAADFDGDDELDVAVSGSGGSVMVLIGNGDGTLGAPDSFFAGVELRELAAADVNDDGIQDIVVAAHTDLAVLLGLGDGSFQASVQYPAKHGSGSIVVGDLDGDLDPDVTMAGYLEGADVVSIFGNDGDGTFAEMVGWAPGGATADIAAADFDGDGQADLATGLPTDGAAAFFFGDPAGGFQAPRVLSRSGFLTDFGALRSDGDRFDDVYVVVGGVIHVFRGGPAGTLTLSDGPFAVNVRRVVDVDANGDEISDLVAFPDFGEATFFAGLGDGTYADGVPAGPQVSSPRSAVAADWNDDGIADLAVSQPFSTSIFLGEGDGTFVQSGGLTFQGIGDYLAPGDFDQDGDDDLAVGNTQSTTRLLVFRSLGDGTFDNGDPYLPAPPGITGLTTGDLDGDGHLDLLSANSNHLNLLFGIGDGTFEPGWNIGVAGGAGDLRAVDLTMDSILDIVVTDGQESVAVLIGLGDAQYRSPRSVQGPYGLRNLDLGDFDGNGSIDVAAGFLDGGDVVTFFRNARPAIFAERTVPELTPGLEASVPRVLGHSYNWTVTGGTITAGQGTSRITFTSGTAGTTMQVSVEDALPGCPPSISSQAVQVQFADVEASSPFSPFIHTIARNGVTSGCGNGNFCPDDFATRAQMAVFLLLSNNGPAYVPPPATGMVFLDVPASAFAAAFIEALAAAQVTSGCGGGNYCPGDFVTREQMAVFLLRTLEGPIYLPPACITPSFLDVPCSSGFARWIEEVNRRGITAGCGGGNYCPGDFVTRAQMAVFLVSTFDLL